MSNIAPTSEDFLNQYPAFAGQQLTALVNAQLAISVRLLDVDVWGDFYSDAVMLDCAHNLEVATQVANAGDGLNMAAGPISGVSGAGLSTSFATVSPNGKVASEVWYSKTSYGQLFMRLRDAVVPAAIMAC